MQIPDKACDLLYLIVLVAAIVAIYMVDKECF
jgi:hypothetical protein